MSRFHSTALCALLCALCPGPASAISVGKPSADSSPEAELASFQVLDGFEVNLFASEKDGVIKPISIRWDERGRLWVITTTSYPQPKPGEDCDDKILILEDTKHSGHADKVTVFADHLRMPTGLELAPGPGNAAYVGEGEKLWLMRDTKGDGHADKKEVIFSGFGTGDTHQCINSFTWTPDGALLFSQGLHAYSNVTTVYGGRKLYGAGFWEYRPLSGKLTPYPTGFPLNAWGSVFDDAGQPFTVAGAAGMFWTTPLLVSTEHHIEGRALPNNGQIVKQGMLKYCGVDIPRNAHWPVEMHGELVSGGFFENCIYRHKLQTDKDNPSGYEAVRQPDLMKSSSVAFRPVDVKFGPDGALYVSDWYNPIIGHYQASFRHPDRDKSHGRIWRVVKKGSPLKQIRELGQMKDWELFALTREGDRWEQYQAQRMLMGMNAAEVFYRATILKDSPPPGQSWNVPDDLYIQICAWFEEFAELNRNPQLLESLLTRRESSERAAAARAIGLWQDHLKDPLAFLKKSIDDEDPRVRLEAIAACSHVPKPESIAVALRALDKPIDSFLDRTLELAIYALGPQWEPALREGKLTLPPKHLAWLLDKKGDGDTLDRIRATLHDKPDTFDPESKRALLLMLAKRGASEDVSAALREGANEKDANLLTQLSEMVEAQQIPTPANAENVLRQLLSKRAVDADKCAQGARLTGLWNIVALRPLVVDIARDHDASVIEISNALFALGKWKEEKELLVEWAQNTKAPYELRLQAISALTASDAPKAAELALALIASAKEPETMRKIIAPFLAKASSTKALVSALNKTPIPKESADLATRALIASGRNEPDLVAILNRILGRSNALLPYNAQWVNSLAKEATMAGNAKRGDEIFHRVTLNCSACHSIGGKGGIIGPQLDAVGRGMPVELIVESVMWPQRQIKEGYAATTVLMKDGRSLAGYKIRETDTELNLRDLATNTTTSLPKAGIQSRADGGSLMPDGLTASLSREELRDLIAYLASLGKGNSSLSR